MADPRFAAIWLRRLASLLALAGTLALTACGGGSGAPNNPFAPTPPGIPTLGVQPATATAYSSVPMVLTVTGGVAPFRAFSSNSAVMPVAQTVSGYSVVLLAADVPADTPVEITVLDAVSQQVIVPLTVKPSTLLNTFTVKPNLAECGESAICSGQTGTASISLQTPTGGSAAGRQVRFDVVSGPFSIQTTNPSQPIASTLTVVSDAAGVAQVVIRANVDAPTQPAQLRATDVTSGQQRTAQFMIVQSTNGTTILTVVPDKTTITAAYKDECSAGVRVAYFVYGGTPPYRVSPSFPALITMLNTTVNNSGGAFEVLTNGNCVSPLTFSIVDATGRQITAQLENLPGSETRPSSAPTPTPILQSAPAAAGSCNGRTFQLLVNGGVPPYAISSSPATTIDPKTPTSAGYVNVSGLIDANPTYLFFVADGAGSFATASIRCPRTSN